MKQKAIIVDIDGTLANNSHRVKYVDGTQKKDWTAFNKLSVFDTVNEWCLEIVKSFNAAGYHIIFLTARTGSAEVEAITRNWLLTHVGPGIPYTLVMREEKDHRTDTITKSELYLKHVAPFYDILFALDDRGRVCEMWRDFNIPALHCEDY